MSYFPLFQIADFGSARLVAGEVNDSRPQRPLNDAVYTQFGGSLLWKAPEIFKRSPCTTRSDVYRYDTMLIHVMKPFCIHKSIKISFLTLFLSFGVVLWEIATRQLPFQEIKFNSQVEDAVMAGRRPALPTAACRGYQTLIAVCWHQDPAMRPSIHEVVRQLELLLQTNAGRDEAVAVVEDDSETKRLIE